MGYENTDATRAHGRWAGKFEILPRCRLESMDDLKVAYTPGVADPCYAIYENPQEVYRLTRKANTVAIVTNGTAILGISAKGPEASIPVMEGKAILFKACGGVDAIPVPIRSTRTEDIVRTIKDISPMYGGIILEDIASPECFEVCRALEADGEFDIPIFHDDQQGTATVTYAALINALELTGRTLARCRIAILGAGAAGIAIARFLKHLGAEDVVLADRRGILSRDRVYEGKDREKKLAAGQTNPRNLSGPVDEALRGADVFIGVSGKDGLGRSEDEPQRVRQAQEKIRLMARGAVVFSMANPIPEIAPDAALAAGAAVAATGSSKFKNQVNNLLAFPGLFRGILDIRAGGVNYEMMAAAAEAIAACAGKATLDRIVPHPLAPQVAPAVARAVAEAGIRTGKARATPPLDKIEADCRAQIERIRECVRWMLDRYEVPV